jgi:large subunit ribosomal protein L15
MTLNNLKPASGSTHKEKRIGRGTGSGHGGTSTRGHKGDKSRSGSRTKRNFEGGQTPIQRRLPKVGFKNFARQEFVPVNLSRLVELSEQFGATISLDDMRKADIFRRGEWVKVLATGALKGAVHVTAHAASAKAVEAIQAAGGTLTLVPAYAVAADSDGSVTTVNA